MAAILALVPLASWFQHQFHYPFVTLTRTFISEAITRGILEATFVDHYFRSVIRFLYDPRNGAFDVYYRRKAKETNEKKCTAANG